MSLPLCSCLWLVAASCCWAFADAQGARPPPCIADITACVATANEEAFRALHRWVEESPDGPAQLLAEAPQASPVELAAFALFRELGLAVLASGLDFFLSCRGSGASCPPAEAHFDQVLVLRDLVEQHLAKQAADYRPEAGTRSVVLRFGRNLQHDVERFARDLPRLRDLLQVVERVNQLVEVIGQRSRTMAMQLGMHYWVRALAVPGRGAPVFVLHDEYSSRLDMLRTLSADMVRNGQREVSVADVGVPPGGETRRLVLEFPGMQYFGIFRADLSAPLPNGVSLDDAYLAEKELLAAHGDRAALHFTTSAAAAAAVPPRALDMAVLDVGAGGDIAADIALWEARVKPGGVLAGHGFRPTSPAGVHAVCHHRHGNDIHLGYGGTFWWFVEPDEE